MKTVILTIDYELFLGSETGSVNECMIKPTEKLSSILERNDSKMTIFWDILHYYKILEFETNHPELTRDRILIENQILDLTKRGHDVQLHLHPHWLDAKYKNGNWNFSYDRFKLHNLSDEYNEHDVNTILGCITISKKLMEKIIRNTNPLYRVTTFRAGGYLVEPFDKIKNALLKNEIIVDSSVCPGLFNKSGTSPYDFRLYPSKLKYNFNSTPKVTVGHGDFIEIPITVIKLPSILYLYFKFIRKIKYPSLENNRKGFGVGDLEINKQKLFIKKNIFKYLSYVNRQLTTDSNFSEKFNYMFKKAPEFATMILHPKLLNSHTYKILEDYVSRNKVQFISIGDFLK